MTDRQIQDILRYIDDHIYKKITLTTFTVTCLILAKTLKASPSHKKIARIRDLDRILAFLL
jgi:hypothetical protein